MNAILKLLLRSFTLVFFDDILVYGKSWKEHMHRLSQVLRVMRQHQLYAKRSKCVFGATQVQYLGHVIDATRVSIDPSKIQVMKDWPMPTTVLLLIN